MAIQISGTTVIDNSRNITNVLGVGDTATTVYYGDGSNLTGLGGGIPSDILVVAGGGGGVPTGGPSGPYGGGGGGGQVISATNYTLSPGQTYTITIGSGGPSSGGKGNNSTIVDPTKNIFTSLGGGGSSTSPSTAFGGCGGGSPGVRRNTSTLLQLQINTDSTSPNPYSYTDNGAFVSVNGFESQIAFSYYSSVTPITFPAKPGAGAGGPGPGATTGYASTITGSPVVYSTGGTGASYLPGPSGGPYSGAAGAANSGDGGGGGNYSPYTPFSVGGAGGSGVVVIKYPKSYPSAPSSPGATLIPSPTHYIYQFTSSGAITLG